MTNPDRAEGSHGKSGENVDGYSWIYAILYPRVPRVSSLHRGAQHIHWWLRRVVEETCMLDMVLSEQVRYLGADERVVFLNERSKFDDELRRRYQASFAVFRGEGDLRRIALVGFAMRESDALGHLQRLYETYPNTQPHLIVGVWGVEHNPQERGIHSDVVWQRTLQGRNLPFVPVSRCWTVYVG